MRLNPALQKPRRHRELDGLAIHAIEIHARKPTRINVLADFGLETFLYPYPALLVRGGHLVFSSGRQADGGTQLGAVTARSRADAMNRLKQRKGLGAAPRERGQCQGGGKVPRR